MKPTAEKNRKLIVQYPFLTQILALPYLPLASKDHLKQVDDLTIKVEKADAQLMYRQGKNTGLEDRRSGSNSWSMPVEGPRNGQAGKRGHYLLAIDQDGHIINSINWDDKNSNEPIYAWHVLWGIKVGPEHFSDALYDQVKYLVWMTVEAWYEFIKGFENTPFGDFIDRTMTVTIYTAPEKGFSKLRDEANVYDHLWLDNDVVMRGSMRNDHDILCITGMLAELCHQFKADVYDKGMREIADSHPEYRIAASGQFGPVEVLVAEMCGYERIQLDTDTCRISFQIKPDSNNAYVFGMQGRLPQLREMVRTVIEYWNYREGGRSQFSYNQEVCVG